MVTGPDTLLPIVVFDRQNSWHDLLAVASPHLDADGLKRLQGLLEAHAQTVVVERHYIDKDYRDTFTNYHSKRFRTPDARCTRLHFFNVPVTAEALLDRDTVEPHYLGYSIIRPTCPYCIGRTLLKPCISPPLSTCLCACEEKPTIQGTQLSISGFPFMSQEGDATVCAQSALWMQARYFSNRYPSYAEVTPFRLTALTHDYALGRLYPSGGLYVWQMAEALRRLTFAPVIYDRLQHGDQFEQLLYTYIESGIPVLAAFDNHVVTLFGHCSNYALLKTKGDDPQHLGYLYSSDACRAFVGHDDGSVPYRLLSDDDLPGAMSRRLSDVTQFVPALPEKVFLAAEHFRSLVLKLLEHPRTGIPTLSPKLAGRKPVLRMFLTSGRSYKRALAKRGMGDPAVEGVYRSLPLPHFIWLCEISDTDLYPERVMGEILWDATRNPYEEDGWIALHYPETLLVDQGTALNQEPKFIQFAKLAGSDYPVFRSNLVAI